MLKNNRRELFCQAIVSGKAPLAAYVAAGYVENSANATHMRQLPEVAARIEELMGDRLKRLDKVTDAEFKKASIDRQWVMAKLIENYENAFASGDFAPANKSLELLGKELGMFIDRKETGGPGDFARMNDDELREFIASSIAGTGKILRGTEH